MTSWSRWFAGRLIVRRDALGLGVQIALAVGLSVGLLSVGLLVESHGRERSAWRAGEAARRVANLIATVVVVQGDERSLVMTGGDGQPISQSGIPGAVVQDVAAIRSGLDASPWTSALIDTLADATHAALAACDTAILRQTRHDPTSVVQDADRVAAHLVTRVRGEAATVAHAAAQVVDTRVAAADRARDMGVWTLGIATFAIVLGLVSATRLTTLVQHEAVARGRAEEANRAKSLFLASMSHELRTPLNAILGFADLLAAGVRGDLTPAQADDVRRIRRAAKHLVAVIADVLRFARLEAKRAPSVDRVPIDAMVSLARAMVAHAAQEKGVELVCRTCDPAWAARANSDKVLQILLNLLSNAIKFTPRGGRVELSCGRSPGRDRDAVWVMVCDTGPGIPAGQIERIFEPFVQAGAGSAAEGEGVGLGLAISRTLARAMHGDVLAQSVEGQGAQFMLVLPREMDGGAAAPRIDP